MGNQKSGNRQARGQVGHRGGTGRPPKRPGEKRTKHVCMSPRLWDLINIRTKEACEDDWHVFLIKVLDGEKRITKDGEPLWRKDVMYA